MKNKERKLFGTDGVRDIANSGNMTPEMALRLGRAFVKFNQGKKIAVGCDTRLSSKMLEGALCAGISSEGADIFSLGIIPTPGVSFAIKNLNADGGAVISASHNPAEYNGIKFLGKDGCKLSDEEELEIEEILGFEFENNTGTPGKIEDFSHISLRYTKHLTYILKNRIFRDDLAFDCADGAASIIIPTLLKYTRISDEHVIAFQYDGLNINKNSGVMHMENITDYVKRKKLKLGFAFDGDADRVLVCDSKGRIIDGDIILWVLSRWLAKKKVPGSDFVVVTVMSNMALESHLDREGITTLRCPVGDRYVLDTMRKSGAGLGGEQSGHIIASKFTSTGDGICTAILFLNAIHDLNEDTDTLIDRFGRYPQKLTNIKLQRPREKVEMKKIDSIVKEYQKNIPDGRIFIRTSGTEPLLRILVEAKNSKVVEKISSELEAKLKNFC